MDEAEYGVICVSLGSLIEPSKIESLGKIFVRVMENLPQRVIIKWDAGLLPYVPKNFLVQQWIPQVDILSKEILCYIILTKNAIFKAENISNKYSVKL